MLSSDILESQFGPTHVAVLKQARGYRIIQTIATNSGHVLEMSFVNFVSGGANGYSDVQNIIRAGESMGKAFRNAGIKFTRLTKTQSKIILPQHLQKYFSSTGKSTVLEVSIFVGPSNQHYCEILEIYSPAVIWPRVPDKAKPRHTTTA